MMSARYYARTLSLLVLILLFAAAARIINVGSWPVWTDEGWSIWATDDARVDVVLHNLAYDRHPPAYFLALSTWRSLSGDRPLALRYLSIAAGVLTVAVTYRIGADVFGRRAGLYAALLLAVLPMAVYYSQEVRHYGWFTLCVALSWLCFLRYLKRPTFGIWLGYVLSVTLAFYTLYFAVLPVAVQVLVGMAWRFKSAKVTRPKLGLIAAWIAAAVLYAPWLWVIVTIQFPTLTTGIANAPGTYAATLANLPVVLGALLLGSQWALLLGLGVLAVWVLVKQGHTISLAWVVVLGGVGLALAMFGLSVKLNWLSGRTLVFLVPLLMVVCGYGASLMDRYAASQVGRVLVGAWVLVTLVSPTVIQPRIDSDQAAKLVAQDYVAGDLIVLETGWDDNAFAYQLHQVMPDAEVIRTISRADIYSNDKDLLPALTPRLEAHRRVWVVQWLQAPQIMSALDAGLGGFRPVIRHELPVNEDYRQRFGDSVIQMVLYEAPQLDVNPQTFGDLFVLRDAIPPTQVQAGARVPVDLWWSVLKSPPLDYSVGVFLLDSSGAVRADHNAAPSDKPTTQWAAGEVYFDRHVLMLPVDLPAGRYSVVVKVYWYGDNQALPVDGQAFVSIGEIEVP